ncbi:MAG TPA: molybdenum cofactor guanylyltransferase [Ilumatobacter sp.]
MTVAPAPIGVILTGGASRRMGSDKAFLPVGGRAMVASVAAALRDGGCERVVCQGGDAARLGALGLEVLADDDAGAGPLAAIRTALGRLGGPIVVAACDLADLDPASVRAVIAAGAGASVSVAVADGRRHLLSWWGPDSQTPLAALIDDGCHGYGRAVGLLGAVEVAVVPAAMRNVNCPDDVG